MNPFHRWKSRIIDGLILAVFAAFAIGIAVSTDRDHQKLMADQIHYRDIPTNLPTWLRLWRPNAIRIHHDAAAFLCVFATGLTFARFRPRRESVQQRRLTLGDLASLMTTLIFAANLANWIVATIFGTVEPPDRYYVIRRIAGISLNLYQLWESVVPVATATVAGAWLAAILASGWRRPVGPFDRMGRFVAFSWYTLLPLRGFIYLLAWH